MFTYYYLVGFHFFYIINVQSDGMHTDSIVVEEVNVYIVFKYYVIFELINCIMNLT